MQKALVLILILVVGAFVVGCNPPATTTSATEKPQTAMNPDGTQVTGKGGQASKADK